MEKSQNSRRTAVIAAAALLVVAIIGGVYFVGQDGTEAPAPQTVAERAPAGQPSPAVTDDEPVPDVAPAAGTPRPEITQPPAGDAPEPTATAESPAPTTETVAAATAPETAPPADSPAADTDQPARAMIEDAREPAQANPAAAETATRPAEDPATTGNAAPTTVDAADVAEPAAQAAPTPAASPATAGDSQPSDDIADAVETVGAVTAALIDSPEGAQDRPRAETPGASADLAEPVDVAALNPALDRAEPVVRQRAPAAVPDDRLAPSFDVVTVSPTGQAVIAGRAEPGAEVTITDGDREIGTVTADNRGEFVLIPDEPLDPGAREIGLVARDSEGVTLESRDVVVLSVPEGERLTPASMAGPADSTLAVLMPRDDSGPRRLLQRAEPEIGLVAAKGLSLDIVSYDTTGQVDFSGQGQPGSSIAAYINNRFIGTATVTADGTWRLVPREIIVPGLYTLRLDQVDAAGTVISRLETPFSMAEFETPETGDGLVVVQPGNSLWRIARRIYGRGIEYTMIYGANTDQIRDPHLIYPGQIFVVPTGG